MNDVLAEPVHLMEDPDTGDHILLYGTANGTRIELKYQGETLWMTQKQMSELYGVNIPTISRHLKNIFDDGELAPEAVISKNERTAADGKTYVQMHYNLDAIISVGYRVNSKQGTQIRKWATEKLVQFATKGFVVDAERLKKPDGHDRIAELREIIRDIRSDEANVYREVKRICSMCRDYDGKSEDWQAFYARVQAKLMWAVTSNTPSEVVMYRANAEHPNMGLRTWSGTEVLQADTTVAKNYLAEQEIRELNRLTTILLDVFEDQLDLGKINTMTETEALLNSQLKQLNRTVLQHGGVVKTKVAHAHAHEQYKLFNDHRKLVRHAEADATLQQLKATAKTLPRTRRSTSKKD